MGGIFEQAEVVFASVGKQTPDTKLLFKHLKRIASFFDGGLGRDGIDWPFNPWPDELYHALSAVCQMPYWKRVWIVQELVVAREIRVLCGDDMIPKSSIVVLMHLRDKFETLSQRPCASRLSRPIGQESDLCFSVLEAVVSRRISFQWMVERFGSSLCANDLDRIYGFLHIIDWPGNSFGSLPRLLPDYSHSRLDLACQCLQYIVAPGLANAYKAWHTTTSLLMTLRLDHNDPDICKLIAARQRSQHATSSHGMMEAQDISERETPFSHCIGKFLFSRAFRLKRHGESGLAACLERPSSKRPRLSNKKNAAAEYEDGFLDAISDTLQLLIYGGKAVGLMSIEATEGDSLLQPAQVGSPLGYPTYMLIVRRHRSLGMYETIGYAIIRPDHALEMPLHLTGLTMAADKQYFCGVFSPPDAIAYFAQWQLAVQQANTAEQAWALMRTNVANKVSLHPFSSYVVRGYENELFPR